MLKISNIILHCLDNYVNFLAVMKERNDLGPYIPIKQKKTFGACQRFFLFRYKIFISFFLVLCNDLLLVIRTALFADSVRQHQRAAFATLHKSRSGHFPVRASLVTSSFGRFIFRTNRHFLTPPYLPKKVLLSPPSSRQAQTDHIRIPLRSDSCRISCRFPCSLPCKES